MQPKFAAQGIATFPIGMEGNKKTPLVKGYSGIGLRGSTQLAEKFQDATMFGFMAGSRNRITVFDWDSTDERGFADALGYFGDSPLKVRTASGKFHAFYQYNGEGRSVRQLGDLPLDVLGGGVIIGAGSFIPGKGTYEIIEGALEDIAFLPKLRNLPPHIYPDQSKIILPDDVLPGDSDLPSDIELPGVSAEGTRNSALWRHCMKAAGMTLHMSEEEGLNAVVQAALEFKCDPPLEEAEILETAKSAWGYELRGENRFGRHGVWFETSEANELITTDQDGYLLISYLRAHNGKDRLFYVANGLAENLNWTLRRLQGARNRIIQRGDIVLVRHAAQHVPALYGWPKRRRPT